MAKQADTKRKLQLLDKPLIGQLITDVIMMADQELLDADVGSAEDYGRVSKRVIQKLCQKYEEELVITCGKVVQRDMCELIESIKSGREELWVNKTNRDEQ